MYRLFQIKMNFSPDSFPFLPVPFSAKEELVFYPQSWTGFLRADVQISYYDNCIEFTFMLEWSSEETL